GWVYCAAVIDAFSRRIVGWSISDRITAEIVVDALEMARWRRRPEPGTVVHADRGAQYTSCPSISTSIPQASATRRASSLS
ncbi:MAG: hypothetical protein EOO27_29270, partial [Comamonadaceae bacterium]